MNTAASALILWFCVVVMFIIGILFGTPDVRGGLAIVACLIVLAWVVWAVDRLKKRGRS